MIFQGILAAETCDKSWYCPLLVSALSCTFCKFMKPTKSWHFFICATSLFKPHCLCPIFLNHLFACHPQTSLQSYNLPPRMTFRFTFTIIFSVTHAPSTIADFSSLLPTPNQSTFFPSALHKFGNVLLCDTSITPSSYLSAQIAATSPCSGSGNQLFNILGYYNFVY